MNIKQYLNAKLEEIFKSNGYDTSLARVTFSDRVDIAHLQCNCAFALAKTLNKNPMLIAQEICDKLTPLKNEFDISIAKPAFINFIIKDEFLSKIVTSSLFDDRVGTPKIEKPKTIVLDYGGANVAKPLHVGHLRSAILGEAFKRLNLFMGNKVISDVHLGDWGLQMGLTIAQLLDDYDMGYYFGKKVPKVELTIDILSVAYPKASARKKTDVEFAERASDITLKLQQKVKGYYDIWLEMRKLSVDDVMQGYTNLGVSFDLWYGESAANDDVPVLVDLLKKQKLAYYSDGALVVDVATDDNTPMPPAIILKHNGAQMYIVTDLATIYQRQRDFKPDKIIYLTDNRQCLHFKQVFEVAKKGKIVGENVELVHIPFGTVNGKDGKPFKTRDGGTMYLNDLIEMVTNKALEKLQNQNFDEKYKLELAKKVGLSAIKFGDMINVINKDYIFDLDKFMTFEGKTGPYIQYTAVRISSLLSKGNFKLQKDAKINLDNEYTRDIVFALLKLIDAFDCAYRDNLFNGICSELYNLCSAFSTFYNNVKILSEQNDDIRLSYLNLSHLVYKAIEISLNILGIEIPEKM